MHSDEERLPANSGSREEVTQPVDCRLVSTPAARISTHRSNSDNIPTSEGQDFSILRSSDKHPDRCLTSHSTCVDVDHPRPQNSLTMKKPPLPLTRHLTSPTINKKDSYEGLPCSNRLSRVHAGKTTSSDNYYSPSKPEASSNLPDTSLRCRIFAPKSNTLKYHQSVQQSQPINCCKSQQLIGKFLIKNRLEDLARLVAPAQERSNHTNIASAPRQTDQESSTPTYSQNANKQVQTTSFGSGYSSGARIARRPPVRMKTTARPSMAIRSGTH